MYHNAVERIEHALPPIVRDLLLRFPHLRVAGGFVRDTLIGVAAKDIDIVSIGPSDVRQDAVVAYARSAVDRSVLVTTERAHTLHWPPGEANQIAPPLQFIRHEWQTTETLFDAFDWTVCRAAFGRDGDSWRFDVGEHFWADLTERRLRFCASRPQRFGGGAAGSMFRLARFAARGHGWTFRGEDLAAIARVRLLEIGTPEGKANEIAAKWLSAPGEGDNARGSGA